MKIKKLYLQNFKGIKGTKIIDFDKDIIFLTGPNGYGKTTIFDAIEICLTGELYRIDKLKVQDGKKNIDKAFYQNEIDKEVVLKLFFELESGIQKMIIAYDRGERKNSKSRLLHFDFYISDYDEEIFDNDFKNFNHGNALTQEKLYQKVNEILEIKNGNFKDIYKIFHYLQQEETTFFLKKTEKERKTSLNFLFGTEKEAEKHEKIKKFYNETRDGIKLLDEEIKKLRGKIGKEDEVNSEKIGFNELFSKNDINKTEQFSFDNENLFDNGKNFEENLALKKMYLNNLFDIKNFLVNFSSEEYKKYSKKEKLSHIFKDSDSQKYFLLQNLFSKIPELQKYNEYYDILQIKNIFEFVKNYEVLSSKEIKEKYNFYLKINSSNGKILYCFVLKNIIENQKLMENQNYKNNLFSASEEDVEKFIISKFSFDLKNVFGIYKKISNPKGIASILFQNFFEPDRYLNLKKNFEDYEILKNFSHKNIEKKYIEIEKIVKILGKEENFLEEFHKRIKRKKELEKDISENDLIISSLNALREQLFSEYRIKFLGKNNFDNSCFFCGTGKINDKKIENIEDFKKFFDEKTQQISNISFGKTQEIEKVNQELLDFINVIENDIVLYLGNEEIQKNKDIFQTISSYITQDDFWEYQDIVHYFSKYALGEIPDNLDEKIANLDGMFQKEIEKYRFFNEKNSKNDLNSKNEILEKFINENKIQISFDINNLTREKFIEKRNDISQKIKDNINGFDNVLFHFIKEASDNYNQNKNVNDYVINLLGEKYEDFILKAEDITLKSFTEKIHFLKNELKNLLQKSYDDFEKIKYLEEGFLENQQNILKFKNFSQEVPNYTEENIKKFITDRKNLYNLLISVYNKALSSELNDLLKGIGEKYILKNFDDISFFEDNLKLFLRELDSIISSISIDDKKLGGNNFSFVKVVFNKNIDLIKKYQKYINKFDSKQKYIEYKFFEYRNEYKNELKNILKLYKERKNILEKVQKMNLSDLYRERIQSYKENIVKSIQIPFFLYTARILQNFGQGFGIFISIQTKGDSGNDFVNESVTFSTGKENVDIMHQLSSGQLAVISVAFLLSVNKVYNQFKYGKFILIDDPIQEMDSLNIHSFVELIKYNFLGEFFMLMSTHDDNNALFMKYKFEQLKQDSVKLINIQNKFYETE